MITWVSIEKMVEKKYLLTKRSSDHVLACLTLHNFEEESRYVYTNTKTYGDPVECSVLNSIMLKQKQMGRTLYNSADEIYYVDHVKNRNWKYDKKSLKWMKYDKNSLKWVELT